MTSTISHQQSLSDWSSSENVTELRNFFPATTISASTTEHNECKLTVTVLIFNWSTFPELYHVQTRPQCWTFNDCCCSFYRQNTLLSPTNCSKALNETQL